MIHKEIPLCSWGSAFGHESTELLPACLINLLPKSFGALSVSAWTLLQHFWGLIWDLEGGVFTSSLSLTQHPWPAGRAAPARCCQTVLIWRWEPLSWKAKEVSSSCTKEPGKTQEPTWEPCSSDWFRFRPASGSRRGVWSTLKRHPSNHFLGVKPCLSSSGSGVEVLCCVRLCESESLRLT
jgi:hypothetical protein